MNVDRYVANKGKGLIGIAKIGNAFAISAKRFNAETGEELDPEVQALSIATLEQQSSQLAQAKANLDQLIADLKAL